MKTRRNNPTPWLAALGCLTLVLAAKGAGAADAPKSSDSEETGAQPKLAEQDIWRRWKLAHDAHKASTGPRLSQGAPTQADKASGLLGMEVRNQNGELLGHIKELVIDWKTEQVSYAVISAAPRVLPSVDEKLLAVPLAAVAPSADRKHLVLNAEKSTMQAAQGFDHDHWPSPSNPSWSAEPFWQHEADKRTIPEQSAK